MDLKLFDRKANKITKPAITKIIPDGSVNVYSHIKLIGSEIPSIRK
jgi:hypothetical protein